MLNSDVRQIGREKEQKNGTLLTKNKLALFIVMMLNAENYFNIKFLEKLCWI